ncbi:MAG TPA: GTP cyclohydrolase II [Rhodocyclaceae bacterium]|nr:GTP cyclohydrolase II [Rhodocyclaceae bacterium]
MNTISFRPRRQRPHGRDSVANVRMPIAEGNFLAHAYRDPGTGVEHFALVLGDPAATPGCLVRVHSECLTGDIFGSRRCDCGPQLHEALRRIAAAGCGVLVYLRGHEGRGIGLVEKLRAYCLQEAGFDTVEANLLLGHPVDARDYTVAADILKEIGVHELSLLTNNPDKPAALAACGLRVARAVPLPTAADPESARYIETKRVKLGHVALSAVESA